MISKFFTFICLCLCIIVVCYIAFFTQDRYISKSQFSLVVKDTSNVDISADLASLVSGGSSANADTQIAIGFIHSADLLLDLEKQFDLITHFSSPEEDYVYRLESDASLEDRLKYYRGKFNPEYNTTTGLIDLSIETFSPDLSFQISKSILQRTELFINDLNKSVAEKRLDFVKKELIRAQESVTSDEQALLAFQNKHRIIQPEAIIQANLEAIQTLRLEKIRKGIELTTLRSSSPRSPGIVALEATIIELNKEIKRQEETFAGDDQAKLSQILAGYKELELNKQFSIKLREGSEILLEKTRAEAVSTSRFFSVVQNPYLSEEHTNPKRIYLSVTCVLAILLSFYVIRALVLSIFDRV